MILFLFYVLASIVGVDAINAFDTALQADGVDVVDDANLLQVRASRQGRGESDEEAASSLCAAGLRTGRFCCGRGCGRCGGRGCQNRPGGTAACCTSAITRSGRACNGPNMQRCLLPRSGTGGIGMGQRPEPPIPATDISVQELVEELALCETSLKFTHVIHSNLGGAGPDGGAEDLVFGEVATNMNLVITATSPYVPNMLNPRGGVLRNGARQGFGIINMASGFNVDLTFKLVDATTGEPTVRNDFVITFFDGDHGRSHESREAIKISGFTSFLVDGLTTLDVDEVATDDVSLANGDGVATFTSTLRGKRDDNPLSPLSLSSLQAKRSVAVLFEDKSEFTVTLSESGYVNPQGRNIFFAGTSNLICEGEARCSSYQCPFGFVLKQDAEFAMCKSKPCSVIDHATCCTAENA